MSEESDRVTYLRAEANAWEKIGDELGHLDDYSRRLHKERITELRAAAKRLEELAEDNREQRENIMRLTLERDELARWKKEQLAVESSWDVQRVGHLLGLIVGDDIRSNIEPKIRELQAELEAVNRKWQSDQRFLAGAFLLLRENGIKPSGEDLYKAAQRAEAKPKSEKSK